jgi:TonB family protein
VAPEAVEVAAGESKSVDLRMSVDETAVNLRVCRDCKAKVPPSGLAPAELPPGSRAIVSAAVPAAGWDAFNGAVYSYPPALRSLRVEGNVLVEGRIDSDGSTTDVHVIASPDRRLNEPAMMLVRQLRWRPAQVRGIAMAAPLHATVEFSLSGD